MNVEVSLIKTFTKDKSRGNPAGVVLDADNLTSEQMVGISSKLGFSESAFVQKPEKADFRVRFFTLTQEVNLCGHATIATFYELMRTGRISVGENPIQKTQQTGAGVLPVTCHPNGLIMMDQTEPIFYEPGPNRKIVATLLSLKEEDLDNSPIQSVSTGTPKLIIPIKNLDRLFAIEPDLDGISQYCREHNTNGFYPFTQETRSKYADFHTRQFNPLFGINEDPITGVAAGALACYASKYQLSDKSSLVIEQGYIMNKEGLIYVDIKDGVKVGGFAVKFDEQTISIK
jgi:PhzF family phenazine biosynthesis protein